MSIELLMKLAEEEEKNPFAKKDEKEVEEPESEEATETPEEEAAEGHGGTADPKAIMEFFAQPGTIMDADFHAFAEQNGFDVHQAEAVAYVLAQKYMALLRGGAGAGMDPNTVDPQELEMGMEAEGKHTECPCTRKKLALDNLASDPQYYTNQGAAATPEGELPIDPSEQPIDEKTAALLLKVAGCSGGQMMTMKKKGAISSKGELEKRS